MNAVTWRVPGRIEVFGKHTDYAGGNVLTCAVDVGVTATARATAGDAVIAHSAAFDEPVSLRAGQDAGLPAGHWGRYLATVVDRLASNFGPLGGIELQVTSDLPLASGMSSSSAMVVATAMAIAELRGYPSTPSWVSEIGTDRLRLANYLAAIENGSSFGALPGHTGVGTFGGSEDHAAMLCGQAGMLTGFGFAPVAARGGVHWPDDWVFVVAVSGVAAEKTGPAQQLYNRASLATVAAVRSWNAATGRADRKLADVVRSSPDATDRLLAILDDDYLIRRVRHFVTESEVLVDQAMHALSSGDLSGFGAAASASQLVAEQLLGNQVPQTVALARLAGELGAVAATSFGAGFGGSVWAMVPRSAAADFADAWLARYRTAFPQAGAAASTLITTPSQAATRLMTPDPVVVSHVDP